MTKLYPEIKTALPGPKSKALIDRDKKTASPSMIKVYPLTVDRGEGNWIYDLDGNRFLDLMAGIAVCSTGHAHPKVVKAIQESSTKFLHLCLTDYFYSSGTDLTERLATYVPAMGPKKVFLTNSGTEAVEGAMKLARFHTRRTNFIAFKGAFHGRTYGAISLNGSKATQRAFFSPMLPGVYHAPYPSPYRCSIKAPGTLCSEACACAMYIENELFKNYMDPKEVAAIFIEPVLGEGGYVVPPKSFLQRLRRICDEHGILLVFDEIQCGVGRMGTLYAADYFGVAPDILLTAKGLGSGMPIGAIIAKESVMTWGKGSHGSTYAGNPVCCAAALATLDIVETLLPQVTRVGNYFMDGLRKLQKTHPTLGDVRGVGLMIGAEFVKPGTLEPATDYVNELEQIGFQKGLLMLSCGKSTIRFCPPLIFTEHEVDVALEIFDQCLTELDKKYV